jgi:hypothetical protein
MKWTWILSCGGAALIAAWLTLSDLHRGNNADSMIPVFVSLYRWTWFYWAQNRYGMLTALLAMPVHHPFLNLLVQNWMMAFSGLLVFPLASAYLLGWRNSGLAGLIAATLFLLAGPEVFHADYLLVQPYGVSTCLGILGLMMTDPDRAGSSRVTRQLFGGALFFLSFWVNLAALFFVLPLFVFRWFVSGARDKAARHFFSRILVIVAPAVANWQIAAHYPYRGDFRWTPPMTWPGQLATLLSNSYQRTQPAFLISLGALLAVAALGPRLGGDPARRRNGVVALAIAVVAGLAYSAVLAATIHVRASGFPFRYSLVTIVLLIVGVASLATSAIADALKPRWQAWLQLAFLLGLLLGITQRYGAPSYSRVRGMLDRRFGNATSALLDNHCTHLLGDYWEVWGATFHANLTLYESGSKQFIWGLTGRGQVTRDAWLPQLLDGGVVGVIRSSKSDEAWSKQARILQLPELKVVRETPKIRVYAPGTAEPGPDPAADAALRRTYGPSDLVLQKCLKLEKDGSIVGENCPPGSLVFGPYVRIPKGATVRVAFEFQSEKKVKLVSDVVSSGGQVFHGALDELEVDPKTVRTVGYRIHVFQDVRGAEARIGMRADGPTNIRITNLRLVVL